MVRKVQSIYSLIGIIVMLGLTACGQTELYKREKLKTEQTSSELPALDTEIYEETNDQKLESETVEEITEETSYIVKEGNTIESRISVPEGYTRIPAEEGSLAAFLRNYPLKEDQSPVLLYNGAQKWNQNAHIAVTKLPLEAEDLQQCADSVMRIYA